MRPYLLLALCLLVVPTSARAGPSEVEGRLHLLEFVKLREYHGAQGHGLELSFPRLPPHPALARFSLDEARAVISSLQAEFQAEKSQSPRARLSPGWARTGTLLAPTTNAWSPALEHRVREAYESLYGPSSFPLPDSLEQARWLQALKLSARYMPEGVREAALEMFSSPATLLSVGLSMMLYMSSWAVPEPFISKAFATSVTLGLLLTYTAAELYTVGLACLNLYREAQAARTPEQLEAAAERFGKAIGGVGLRVLATVAGAKLARGLPEVPTGGLWARLSPPRLAFSGGPSKARFSFTTGSSAQVSVANGTVVLMGVSASTAASAVASSVASSRTTGACRDASNKGDAEGHHLATDKNEKSTASGGPWTPRFKDLFDRAGMSLDDPANIVYLIGHKGPHPEEYHRKVHERLDTALEGCRTQTECRSKLIDELNKLATEICTPGSKFNKLIMRRP